MMLKETTSPATNTMQHGKILVTEAMQEELRKETDDRDICVREKRRYVKSNSEYWTEGIRAS